MFDPLAEGFLKLHCVPSRGHMSVEGLGTCGTSTSTPVTLPAFTPVKGNLALRISFNVHICSAVSQSRSTLKSRLLLQEKQNEIIK